MRGRREDNTTGIVLLATFGAMAVAALFCGVPLVAAIAIPNFVEMQYRAKRAEVPANVDGIKTAEMAYHAVFDTYVATEPAPRTEWTTDKNPVSWTSGPDWQQLGWEPDGQVRGAYWVEVSPDGSDFTVFGAADIDGDGSIAVYTATRSVNTVFLNNNSTY